MIIVVDIFALLLYYYTGGYVLFPCRHWPLWLCGHCKLVSSCKCRNTSCHSLMITKVKWFWKWAGLIKDRGSVVYMWCWIQVTNRCPGPQSLTQLGWWGWYTHQRQKAHTDKNLLWSGWIKNVSAVHLSTISFCTFSLRYLWCKLDYIYYCSTSSLYTLCFIISWSL